MRISILACAAVLAIAAGPSTATAATVAAKPANTAKPPIKLIRGQHTEYMWQGMAAHPTGGGKATATPTSKPAQAKPAPPAAHP